MASRLNVTNKINFMFEKKNIWKIWIWGSLKRVKRVLIGQKSYFFGIFTPGAVPRSSALCLFSTNLCLKKQKILFWPAGQSIVTRPELGGESKKIAEVPGLTRETKFAQVCCESKKKKIEPDPDFNILNGKTKRNH